MTVSGLLCQFGIESLGENKIVEQLIIEYETALYFLNIMPV
jgi:hypothetical protein